MTLVVFAIAVVAIEVGGVSEVVARRVAFDAFPACLTYIAFRFAFDLVPRANAISQKVADVSSRYLTHAPDAGARLSFNALGGPPIALAMLYLLWNWRRREGLARLIIALVLPLAWFGSLAIVTPDVDAGLLATIYRGAGYGVLWLAVAVVICFVGPLQPRAAVLPMRRNALVAACLAATSAGVCLVGTAAIGSPEGRSIVVDNRGGLDWERPVFGRFGIFNGGMFGLLPVYCRADGFKFEVIEKDKIAAADLKKAQILVLINSPKEWKGEERQNVLDFVARGGSLLVLGDHTDVFGLMRGFNSLLGPLGIKFRFDSAYKARGTWRGCQAAAPDAVAWGWDDENPGVAVGASLELSGNARPLLVGATRFPMRESVRT